MKNFFISLATIAMMAFTAQVAAAQTDTTAVPDSAAAVEEVATAENANPFQAGQSEIPLHQQLKTKFIEGGPGFMASIILCLIFGLAISIERILYLSFSKTNTKKLLAKIETALNEGGVEAAKEVCRTTRGPVASIFYQGFLRMDQGIEVVEKTVVSYGSVQMSLMENGLTWVALFIALSTSLGFLGTVVGMVQAFDAIQAAGDISPNVVAGGMKVALITTVGGLIVAIILQVFYNYIEDRFEELTGNYNRVDDELKAPLRSTIMELVGDRLEFFDFLESAGEKLDQLPEEKVHRLAEVSMQLVEILKMLNDPRFTPDETELDQLTETVEQRADDQEALIAELSASVAKEK